MIAKVLVMIVSAKNCHVYQGWPSTLPETHSRVSSSGVTPAQAPCPPPSLVRYAGCLQLWRWSGARDSDGSSEGWVETLNRRLYLARAMRRDSWGHHTSHQPWLHLAAASLSTTTTTPHQPPTSCFSLQLLSFYLLFIVLQDEHILKKLQ